MWNWNSPQARAACYMRYAFKFFSFVRKSPMTVAISPPVCDSKLVNFLKCMPVKLFTLNCLFDRLYLNQCCDDRPHDKSWCLKPQRHKVITCAPTWRLLTHCVAKKKTKSLYIIPIITLKFNASIKLLHVGTLDRFLQLPLFIVFGGV